MTDDLVQRLRRTYRKEYAATGPMFADNSNRLCPFPILATEVLFNPDGAAAADCIEALEAEVTRLKDKLSVETEPSPYCPICGSCGDEGCCGSKRCLYPAADIEALSLANQELRSENERLREALTPSGATKAAYISEFIFTVTRFDEDGEEYPERHYVPWTTVKEIMAAIVARAALQEQNK